MSKNNHNTSPLKVANMSFMLERMGADCGPLQHVRELTQNAIEAIRKSTHGTGEILWEFDEPTYKKSGVRKLSIIDNGIGMTGEEMIQYINHLSSSSNIQSLSHNFGVGAKISAGVSNPHGLVYVSWKDGVGQKVHFWKDPETGEYGLKPLLRPDGSSAYWVNVDDHEKPSLITQHGTKVILLGSAEKENTFTAHEDASVQSKWLRRYLNSRYAKLPEGIRIRVREDWVDRSEQDLYSRTFPVTGQIPYLEKHAEKMGCVDLQSAIAHWWLLKEEPSGSQIESGGHIAALYQNELYELKNGRTGTSLLQQFGIIFGARRVVLYLEVDEYTTPDLTTNTARTNLIMNGKALPWEEWAQRFRGHMPDDLKAYIKQVAEKAEKKDHREAIAARLEQMRTLFNLASYCPPEKPSAVLKVTTPRRDREGLNRKDNKQLPDKTTPRIQRRPPQATGDNKDYSLPDVQWVSISDGTREPGDIEDRAAKYIANQHLLLINADFRVFTGMIDRWNKVYADMPGADVVVRSTTHEWFEQTLIETVMGSFSLHNSSEWKAEDLERLLSPEALTAVVLPRYGTDFNIARSLSVKMGSPKKRGGPNLDMT